MSSNYVIPQVTMPFQPYFYIATSKVGHKPGSCHDDDDDSVGYRERGCVISQ